MTRQPFVLVPAPEGVAGLHYTDTHLLACASCKATIADGVMEHAGDCAWIAVTAGPAGVMDAPMYSDNELRKAVAAERERIRQLAIDADAWYVGETASGPGYGVVETEKPFADLIGGEHA